MEKDKTLVLGASLKPQRYSNIAIHRLRDHEVPTYAIGLRKGEVAGVPIETEKKDWDDVHTVTLYLNAGRQKEFYKYILELAPERVIFNPGAENPEFSDVLRDKGIESLERCTLVMLSLGNY